MADHTVGEQTVDYINKSPSFAAWGELHIKIPQLQVDKNSSQASHYSLPEGHLISVTIISIIEACSDDGHNLLRNHMNYDVGIMADFCSHHVY